MKTSDLSGNTRRRHPVVAAVPSSIFVFAVTHGHTPGSYDIDWPARWELGSGPRTSVGGNYAVMLQAQHPSRLLTMNLSYL